MKRWAPVVVVAAVTAAAFARSLQCGFVYDDGMNLERLRTEGWTWIFTDTFGHYMPVTWATMLLDRWNWGERPLGYHLTNVLFHVANAVLFYFVTLRLIGGERRWAAAVGALLFAVHPLRVESVTWVTERRDVVMGLFALLSVLAYLRGRIAVSVVCFALALLSKTMAMTLPLALVALDVWVLKRRAWREKIPFVLLMLGAVALTWFTQRDADAINPRYPVEHALAHPGYRFSFYLWKTAAPIGLSPLYVYDRSESAWEPPFLIGAAVMIGGTILAWRRKPVWAAWICYAALIAPVIGVVQAGPHFAADRYTYLACMPFAVLAAAWGVRAAPLVALYVALTVFQIGHWRSEITLWERAVAVEPSSFAHYNLGLAYHHAERYEEAARQQSEAIRLTPKEWKPYFNRAGAYRRLGQPEAAVADLTTAIELKPDEADSYRQRGRILFQMNHLDFALRDLTRYAEMRPGDPAAWAMRAAVHKERGAFLESSADFTRALALDPSLALAWQQRGEIRLALGDAAGAISDLTEALRLAPDSWTFYMRGLAHVKLESWSDAEADFSEAIRLVPRLPLPYLDRGAARLAAGNREGARADAQRALDLAPDGWVQRPRAEALLKETE